MGSTRRLKNLQKTRWDGCLFQSKHTKGYRYLCIVSLNAQSSSCRTELSMSSLNALCKTALRNTLAINDNVGGDQTTLMQYSLGTMTGFSRCKEMLVWYLEGMLEHDVRKGSHAGLPSEMSLQRKNRKRKSNMDIQGETW